MSTSPDRTASASQVGASSPFIFGGISAPVTAMTASSVNSSSGPKYVISSPAAPSSLPTR